MKPLDVDLSGRVALITGANSGMGKETARELARMGAEVILGCRSPHRGEAARAEITESIGATAVSVMEIDLSSLASVRAFATGFHDPGSNSRGVPGWSSLGHGQKTPCCFSTFS